VPEARTLDAASLHAVGRQLMDVDIESGITHSVPLTHDGKRQAVEGRALIGVPGAEAIVAHAAQTVVVPGVPSRFQ
jgi:hypothetical protein